MRLSQRLLGGFLFIILVLVALVVTSVERRVRERLLEQAAAGLLREARLVAMVTAGASNPDSLADQMGAALGHRVTLIATDGRVTGDSEFDDASLVQLENHRSRPEVVSATRHDTGTAVRRSASAGDVEVYAAVRDGDGVARVSLTFATQSLVEAQLRRDIFSAAALAALAALVLALLFARSVTRPILELRDDARAIAGGDLRRRPSLSAPGEVGELASAFHRLAEQLTARVEALEADDALLRAVSDALNEGVVALDTRQQVQQINEGARRLLQVRDALPFSADQLPRDRALREALADAMAGRSVDGVETRLADRVVTITARPLTGGGAVLALFDITPIRRLETVRRDFVANVSHELKTPLTVVSGFAETLQDESVSPEQRQQFLTTILNNTQRMHRLVDDLLDLSRIESGGWRPAPVLMDFGAVAGETLSSFSEVAGHKGLELKVEIAPDATAIRMDPTAIRQILTNLVHNAIRHTARGAVTIFSHRSAEQLTFGVRDTGSGIAAEHLPRVFERFYRVDASRSRAEGGTGLGLAIVKHLVEAHGGAVTAESAVGSGTTFRVTLPG
ncbi:MAG: HAMP domain-containing protein [Gemmatimonadetes bacterium]|nr:HAMP domain-containing protein [Gemmatimonadota bacterium]